MVDHNHQVDYKSEECKNNSSNVDLQSMTASNVRLSDAGSGLENSNGIRPGSVYDPFANRDTTHQTSDFGALIHMFKGSFGSGILAVPNAFKSSGLLLGLLGTVLTGIICSHCVSVLVKCSHELSIRLKKPSLGFSETAEGAFSTGPKSVQKYASLAKCFCTVALFLTYYLGNTVYIVLISEAFKQILETHLETKSDIRVYIALVSVLIMPLGIGRRLKYLVPISAFGCAFIIFGLVVTFYYALSNLPPLSTRKEYTSFHEIPMFFATIVFAMEGIGTVLPVENSMRNPDHFRGYCGILSISMTLIVSLYVLVGFVCYWSYGDKTKANIILNLPDDALSETVKVLVALSILFTYGLQFCVPSEIVWNQIKDHLSVRYENMAYYSMRGIMIIGTIFTALAIPNLGPFIALVGALCLSTLGLLIPATVETVTYWEKDKNCWRLIKNILIIIFSLAATISGTYASIEEMIYKYSTFN